MLTVFLLSSAALLTTPHWLRTCSPTAIASARHGGPRAALDPLDDPLERLSAALPYLGAELLAEDVRYSGLGVTLQGRDAYAAATAAWSRVLPQRLGSLQCERKTVLPPDSRRRVTARYSLEFEAPVPPQVLPAQRARLLSAGVPTSGLVAVRATIVGTIELDEQGRVCRQQAWSKYPGSVVPHSLPLPPGQRSAGFKLRCALRLCSRLSRSDTRGSAWCFRQPVPKSPISASLP